MPCFHPITAWRPLDGGPLAFSEKKDHRQLEIKCGRCTGCRILKRDGWALRCLLESKTHAENSFLTLTYSPDHYPAGGSLNYRHIQLFLKRVRNNIGPFRFFAAGEYGDSFGRPHYHLLCFGLDFPDKRKSNSLRAKQDLFESPALTELWGKGHASIGQVTLASARYCASYTLKKVTGEYAERHYERIDPITGEVYYLTPEFAQMSRRPGLGRAWLEKYYPDIYISGARGPVVNGRICRTPAYFHTAMETIAPEVLETFKQEEIAKIDHWNNSPERLAVREEIALAKQKFNLARNQKTHDLQSMLP